MCICVQLPQVKLSDQSVQKLLRLDGLELVRVERRMTVDSGPIVLAAAVNDYGRKVHHVLCAGDVWYRKEKRILSGGALVTEHITHDTYKCPRKAAFRHAVLEETVAQYQKQRFSYDPRRLIMDMFARVSRGEYLGEFSPGVLYVQEVAEILGRVYRLKAGLVAAKTYCGMKQRKQRYAQGRPMFFLCLDLSIDKTVGTLRGDNAVQYAPLTEREWRTVAFFEDTQSLIDELTAAKQLALHGMILCTPFPDELPDHQRVLLPERDSFVVYTSTRDTKVLQVQRHYDPEYATLCIFEQGRMNAHVLLATKVVHLLYGAEFGPDVGDIVEWKEVFERFSVLGFLQ